MRKVKTHEYIKLIVASCIGAIIGSLSIGYANTILYAGNEVSYNNSTSGLNSTTVQGALDEMCTVADFSDRVSTLESTSSSTTSRVSTLEGYFQNPTSYITGNGIALGRNNTSTTGNTYIDVWYNNKIMANIYSGPNTGGSGLTISANNASGASGQGTLDLRGNPVKINGVNAGKQPVEVSIAKSFTSSTTNAYTGAAITIPANSYFSLFFIANYNYSKPINIGVSNSPTTYSEITSNTVGINHASTFYSGKTGTSGTTLYVWTKYASAALNRIDIYGFYIPE